MKVIFRIWILLGLLLGNFNDVQAQADTTARGVQISLITCGVGEEIYSVFGHSAVRIIDSNNNTDIVYNYGTFDGYDKDFEVNFMRGKLMYYLSIDGFEDFVEWYGGDGRWVTEQVINGSDAQKLAIKNFLEINMLPQNRAYKYDFFFDNCATRIRDIFTETFGDSFEYPNVLPTKEPLSFRDIINQYLSRNVWERFGINILLGSKIDKPMTNAEIMFLPDFLQQGIAGATLDNKAFAAPTVQLLAAKEDKAVQDLTVHLVLWVMFLLVAVGVFVPKLEVLSSIIGNLILFITGLLGVLMLFMWFGTDHQTCANNYNVLWALPTNLFFIFKKKQYKYAVIAMLLIVVSVVFHLLKIQQLLLPEMLPLLLSLLFIFGLSYRKAKNKIDAKNTITQ